MTDLREEALAARMLLSAMREADYLDEESEAMTVASETNLAEAMEAALVANAMDAAHVMSIKQIVADMELRAARKTTRIERRKGAILAAMEIAGLAKMELATATLTAGKGTRAVIITDEDAIPEAFKRSKTTTTPDKKAIAAELMAKRPVSGAELSNAMPTLRITSK